MSAGTMAPARASRAERAVAGFRPVLRAEWTKLRTVRGWVIGMIIAAVVMDFVGLFVARSSVGCGVSGGPMKTGAACLPPVTVGPGGEPVNDTYYLVGRPLGANGSLTVRVTSLTGRYLGGGGPGGPGGPAGAASPGNPLANTVPGLQPWSKAGIIVTASTKQGSAYAALMVTGSHGVAMQYDYTQSVSGRPGAVTAASPRWLRLVRAGDTVTGYDSTDGAHWALVGTAHLAGLAATARAGLFATSPEYVQFSASGHGANQVSPSLATGVFDHVSLSGGRPGAAWAGVNVGGASGFGPQGNQVVAGFRRAGGEFTLTGSGDIAPLVNGPGSGVPMTTVGNHLVGAFAGLIAVAVVAGMFMTAEYRRGLIRVTLAASPRRGQVLAAKAIVAGLAAFAAGLVAAIVAVAVGPRMDRASGLYVVPVSWLTEVRIVAGTAALLAVVAVLAVALGAVMRRSAAVVTTTIVAIVLPFILGIGILPVAAGEWVLRVSPAAAFAVQQGLVRYPQVINAYTPNNGYFPLAPWAGFGVLCLYAALALALGVYLLRRRDA
jgi:ABC-type transport system involved in multi-copper enzyme maturation permease subunit